MLESAYFFAGCFAIIYVVYWVLRNDGVASIEEQQGWLRMRAANPSATPERRKRRKVGGTSRDADLQGAGPPGTGDRAASNEPPSSQRRDLTGNEPSPGM